MELSVLFVNYNGWEDLGRAIDTLRAALAGTRFEDAYEVLVVDNASPNRTDETVSELRTHLREAPDGSGPDKLILAENNDGYSIGMNRAWRAGSGRYVLCCNPDLIFLPGSIELLIDRLEQDPTIGATAPRTFGEPGLESLLPAGVLPTVSELLLYARASVSASAVQRYRAQRTSKYLHVWGAADKDVEIEMLGGWFFAMRQSDLQAHGFFDERYPLYYEDTDLSQQIAARGQRIVQVHDAKVVHLWNRSGATAPDIVQTRRDISELIYFRRWHGLRGALAVRAQRAFMRSDYARAKSAVDRHGPLHPLPLEDGQVVLRLDAPVEHLLVEIAFDPYFFLAAAAFGSGQEWRPGPHLGNRLAEGSFLRAVDISSSVPRELGIWSVQPD